MTWEQFMELIDWMTVRWNDVSRWGEERLYAMFQDLKEWPLDGALRVVKGHYEDGNVRAPHGGQIIRLMKDHGYSPLRTDGEHKHVWSIEEWETERKDGQRLGCCVICSTERTFSPTVLRTPGEWAESQQDEARLL